MRIEQLKYFIDVAETHSISTSARLNFISPQALSASLLNLEKEINYSLLFRSTKGVELTPAGSVFLPHAKKIMNTLSEAMLELETFSIEENLTEGCICIYSASNISDFILPTAITLFNQKYPNVKITISEYDPADIINVYKDLTKWDLIFLTAIPSYIDELLQYHEQTIHRKVIYKDHLILCVHKNSSLLPQNENNAPLSYQHLTEISKDVYTSYYNFIAANNEQTRQQSYAACVTISNNAFLHKALLEKGKTITYMPFLSYKYKFNDGSCLALSLKDAHPTEHTLLFKNTQLIQEFINYVELIEKNMTLPI